MADKVVGLGFEIMSKLDSYFLMTVMEYKQEYYLCNKTQILRQKLLRNVRFSINIFLVLVIKRPKVISYLPTQMTR